MKTALQKKLFEKYPDIFRQKDLSMKQTCMCWGITCGDGWYWLIDNLCGAIQGYLGDTGDMYEGEWRVEAVQVKEKFGRLCFYVNISDEEIDGMIRLATYLSYRICESCGTTENVKVRGGRRTSTLCARCDQKRKEE